MQESRKSTAGHTRKGEAADEKTANMPFLISCFWGTGMFHACCVCAPCLLRLCSVPIAFGSYAYCISARNERHGTGVRIDNGQPSQERINGKRAGHAKLFPCIPAGNCAKSRGGHRNPMPPCVRHADYVFSCSDSR